MNTAEILRAAAARVRQSWCQYALRDGGGGVCALGALRVPFGLEPEDAGRDWINGRSAEEVYRILGTFESALVAICAMLRTPYMGYTPDTAAVIAQWNNGMGQTAENVAQGLEYAALLWEQEQISNETHAATSEPKASARC